MCTGTFVHFFSFNFFPFWDFSMYKMQIYFGFKNNFFFLKHKLHVGQILNFGWYLSKYPEIFSKWNRVSYYSGLSNITLNKIPRVAIENSLVIDDLNVRLSFKHKILTYSNPIFLNTLLMIASIGYRVLGKGSQTLQFFVRDMWTYSITWSYRNSH